MRTPCFITTLILLIALMFLRNAPAAEIEVGVARVDITPSYPIRLSGYLGRDRESAGVAQRIWAKALAIGSDAEGPVVLVAVDNLGVGETVVEEVAGRLKKSVHLPRARFAVASSHTHSAPCLTGVAPHIFGKGLPATEQAAIDRYTRELTDAIERVSLDALKARQPGKLAWAQGTVGFAKNRRTKGGPVDHSLPVLRASDRAGALRAVVLNYACHCTTLAAKENTIAGDWAGCAQEAIEADHQGVIALTLVGCGADANPTNQYVPGAAVAHGRALADEFNRLLKGSWTELSGPVAAAFEPFTLAFDTLPTREQLQALVKAAGPPGYNASVQLAKLDRGEPLQSRLNYSTQAWKFGDALALVFLPGEVVVDYVLRLKKELDPGRLWVTAYANDVPCYIPSERILREGGYEGGGAMVYYARPTKLKPGLEDVIVSAVHKVVGPRFAPVDDPMPPSKPPREALATFQTRPGLRVELVAAEPLIESPVAVDFGADGRLWVCEMRDYPTGLDGNWKPGGAVKVLTDVDGDGQYDKGTVFLDGLAFPTGVMAWRKGVLICAAPEIIYAEDTDGDGKADIRRVLFQGFATENYQARVNGLSYALDNWVYGANGLIGGTIRGTATGRDVNIGGRDFRINPDSGIIEPATGLTQQGRVHDDWGNQFGGNNSVLIQHYPFPDSYARRNRWVAAPGPAVYLPRDQDSTRLFPSSVTAARYNHPESANRVTSACGIGIYRDDKLGTAFKGNAFICEPVHNLVRREILTPDGVTFADHKPAEEGENEFLSSSDPWFRPVQARTAPDGALWIVDMHRFVIEHPRWISPDLLAGLDVRAGAKQGRIYRVVPENAALRPLARLEALSTPALTAALDSPNGTVRENIQRLLAHRADRTAVPILMGLLRDAQAAETRVSALASLDALKSLDPNQLIRALNDIHPGVRREAVRLSEAWLGKDDRITRAVVACADDSVAPVRFQVGLSLGAWNAPEAGRVLGALACRDAADSWIRAAVLSSSFQRPADVLASVLVQGQHPPSALVEPLIATLSGQGDRAEIVKVLDEIGRGGGAAELKAVWKIGAVAQLLDSAKDDALIDLPTVHKMITQARILVVDANRPAAERAVALRLLGRIKAERDSDRTLAAARLDPSEAAEVQAAAVRVLAGRLGTEGADVMIERWNRLGPTLRATVLDALSARRESASRLLDAVETHRIAPGAIDAAHREGLIRAFGERASKLFAAQRISGRDAVLASYRGDRLQSGDPARGKAVFARICSACHKFGDVGHEVGPDLAALTDTTPDTLASAVLDPNREVDARYATYSAALTDGRVVTGLIASETANAITLKRQEGQCDVILRAALDELKTDGRSLMPEGLENDLKGSDLADVIAYVSRGVESPKVLAGNRPETVAPKPDDAVRLPASSAAVFGPTLTFEPETKNLGYWHSLRDRAAWTFRTDRPHTYTLSMEWACADESAGNKFVVQVDQSVVRAGVGGTGAGTWQKYQTIFLGEVTLPAGMHRLEFRPAGPIQGALLDLRAVVLTPRLNHPKP
jgi:putative membrane-bound dehydrogenase-like protein